MSKVKSLQKWDRYWRLTIIWESKYMTYWKKVIRRRMVEKCQCDCWKILRVRRDYLKNWHTQSCWCLALEEKRNRITHWDSRESWWHPLYRIFVWILERCNCKTSSRYGYYWWRWIKCLRKDYEEFKNDMLESYVEHCNEYWEKNTTLDRINNNWNYCRENCKWATKQEQASNRRTNIKEIRNWEELTITEIYNIASPVVKYWTFYYRYIHGRSIEEALHTPLNWKYLHSYDKE